MDEVKISALFGIMLCFCVLCFVELLRGLFYYYAFMYGLFCVLFAINEGLFLINLCEECSNVFNK